MLLINQRIKCHVKEFLGTIYKIPTVPNLGGALFVLVSIHNKAEKPGLHEPYSYI